MRLPRNLSGRVLIKSLQRIGYEVTRQTGSHVRLTILKHGEHHITIPLHNPLRIGTLASVLSNVANHLEITRDELLSQLFD